MLAVDWLGAGDRESAAALWRELETRTPGLGLFARWSWTSTLLEHFGDVVDHRFAVVRDVEQVAGLALVTRYVWRRGPLRIRRAHLGTAGEPAGESVYV